MGGNGLIISAFADDPVGDVPALGQRVIGCGLGLLNVLCPWVGLYLNARHELIHKEIVSIGTANASIVHPRDVFVPALLHNAVAVIVAHNHPSGDATPSPEDRDVTHRLKEAGKLLGISVLDHIIITEYGYSTL
jgi:DNA repair protein RadC